MDDRKWSNSRSFAMLLNFGLSLAIKVWLIGVLLGGWIDEKFFDDSGYVTIILILLVIIFSFVSLYRTLVAEENERAAKRKQKSDAAENNEVK